MSKTPLLFWDIYEITTDQTEIHGVMLRGRIRKLGLNQGFNVLCENATDAEKCVRFAVPVGEPIEAVADYLKRIMDDAHITLAVAKVANPVLSKLKVNQEERYTL